MECFCCSYETQLQVILKGQIFNGNMVYIILHIMEIDVLEYALTIAALSLTLNFKCTIHTND